MPTKRIGQSMIEANLINHQQLDELLEYQKKSSERVPLGRLSVDLGLVREDEFAPFLASYFNVPYVNLEEYLAVRKEALEVVPESIAKRFNILPILKQDDTLTVAMSDPLDLTILENLQTVTRHRIKPVVSTSSQIRRGIKRHYTAIFLTAEYEDRPQEPPLASAERYRQGWPLAVSLVRLLIERAFKNDIKYIHIQQEQGRMEIFFRTDRRLKKAVSYPKAVFPSVLSFVKKTAKLSLEKTDTPQLGYFTYTQGESNIEVGVSIFPTLSGERIVLEVPRRIGWLDEEAWFKPF